MAECAINQPKSLIRPKQWSMEVENAYRYQLAGYRDEKEYVTLRRAEVSSHILQLLVNFKIFILLYF